MGQDEEWVTRDATDSDFGSWSQNMYKDGNQKGFLGNFGEELLYAWKLFNKNELQQSVLAILDGKQTATVDGEPAAKETASHRKHKKNGGSIDKSELIESLDQMTHTSGLADMERARTS